MSQNGDAARLNRDGPGRPDLQTRQFMNPPSPAARMISRNSRLNYNRKQEPAAAGNP
jgi:hypothetical protein